uniref:Uncharacterized protein n=1 Tax=Oryza punctata TaxID=4537 RepID=A0A0E0JSP0_ORYPU
MGEKAGFIPELIHGCSDESDDWRGSPNRDSSRPCRQTAPCMHMQEQHEHMSASLAIDIQNVNYSKTTEQNKIQTPA